MDNSEKLIQRIKNEGLQPKSKWVFLSKQWSAWLIFILSIVFGALSFSIILYSVKQTEFELLNHISHSTGEFILAILPFFWLTGLFLFLLFAMYSIQYSKKAYKFTLSKLFLFSISMSIVLGTIYFIGGGGGQLERTFADHVSMYNGLEKKKKELWTMPEEGYLSGTIVSVKKDTITILDFKNEAWVITTGRSFIASKVKLEKAEKIKVIGKLIEGNIFDATEVLPWGRRNRLNNK